MKETSLESYSVPLDASTDASLHAVAKISIAYTGKPIYAYERGPVWHIGIDSQAALKIDPTGQTVSIDTGSTHTTKKVTGDVKRVISQFTSGYAQDEGMIFGQLGFNYSAYINGITFVPGSWPLVDLWVPRLQVRVLKDAVVLKNWTREDLQIITTALTAPLPAFSRDDRLDESMGGETYKMLVQQALREIHQGSYEKIIASRAIDLPFKIDMLGTLVCGRLGNTPRSSFFFDHHGLSAAGFSPELVMSSQDAQITTEPLAGTRANIGTAEERARLRKDLLNDPKEVMEHIMSVQEAMREMNEFCVEDSVAVADLMSVKQRGRVQHLASTVTGALGPGKDVWDALNVLFPSITATGIPKIKAIDAIHRLETRPRELYSGAILLFEGSNSFEASLVLRSVFQDSRRSWVQAGAGIIALSKPERELTETCEKLKSFAPFVMSTREDRVEVPRENGVEAARVNGVAATRENGIESARENGIESARENGIEAAREMRVEA